jgi:hypothetical protein
MADITGFKASNPWCWKSIMNLEGDHLKNKRCLTMVKKEKKHCAEANYQ